jgi:hypothetical protein
MLDAMLTRRVQRILSDISTRTGASPRASPREGIGATPLRQTTLLLPS